MAEDTWAEILISDGKVGLASKSPSSILLLVDFCFGGRVISADIFANSGLGSRFSSSSGFFSNGFIVLYTNFGMKNKR